MKRRSSVPWGIFRRRSARAALEKLSTSSWARAGLLQRAQHEFGHVRFPGLRRAVTPGAAVSFPPREPLLCEAVQNCHYRGVGQITLGEVTTDLPDGERVRALPEDVHDRAFKLAETVHDLYCTRQMPDNSGRAGRPGEIVQTGSIGHAVELDRRLRALAGKHARGVLAPPACQWSPPPGK